MAHLIEMPRLSDDAAEGKLISWLKSEGDAVVPGEPLAEIETDKAAMELDADEGGVLLKILAQPGDSLPIGHPIAIVGQAGEDVEGLAAQAGKKPAAAPDFPEPRPVRPAAAQPAEAGPDPSPRISPVARKLAHEAGVDARSLRGSGPGGRVVKRDVLAVLGHAFAPGEPRQAAPGTSVSLETEIGAGPVLAAAETYNAFHPERPSALMDWLLKALAAAAGKCLELDAGSIDLFPEGGGEPPFSVPFPADAALGRIAENRLSAKTGASPRPAPLALVDMAGSGIVRREAPLEPGRALRVTAGALRETAGTDSGKRLTLRCDFDPRQIPERDATAFVRALSHCLEHPAAMG